MKSNKKRRLLEIDNLNDSQILQVLMEYGANLCHFDDKIKQYFICPTC